uniref:Calmodulin-lysine N-methyltransferase n=1 Tax=Chrysotila carterae TaxID=13221 RepID=A0A7S4BTE9_CHRCT
MDSAMANATAAASTMSTITASSASAAIQVDDGIVSSVPAPVPRAWLVLGEGSAAIHGRVWDSGVFFAEWIAAAAAARATHPRAHAYADWRGRRVVELGAGCGVAGLAAAKLGAALLLTDLEEALPLLRLNAVANAAGCSFAPRVAALSWGSQSDALLAVTAFGGAPIDLVLCTDVVYAPELYEPLLQTLRHLTTSAQANQVGCGVLMAHRSRHPDEHRPFFDAAAETFAITVIHGPPLPFLPDTQPSQDSTFSRAGPTIETADSAQGAGSTSWSGDIRVIQFIPKAPDPRQA